MEMSNNEIEAAQKQMVELQQQQQQHVEEDKVTIDMKKIIGGCGDGALLPDCCIYRVPLVLRQQNEKAYTPKLVSVGPFHYGNKKLQDMERHKQIMFKRFTHKAKSSLDDLVRLVKHLEPKVRASYSGTINLTEQELVKMTLMDASFIIELISMTKREMNQDAKLSQPWLEVAIIHDLILLENQLPFFVIEELFNKAFPQYHSFMELVYEYFGYYNQQELKPNPDVEIKHFTDLLRLFYLQERRCQRNSFTDSGSHFLSYNARALKEAGIKFEAATSKCLLDLKLSRHILEIPQIVVDDHTEILFRNMIALEQCRYPLDSYITDYALLLDCLIDTYKDVDLFIGKKIVNNHLGYNKSVALLFNRLCKNVNQRNFNSEYCDICRRLNDYCQNPCRKRVATLRRDHCPTPWQGAASIAGIVLLLLTIVQTIFSILQAVQKK
ncbi:hypothetical protein QN277_000571 [Acacia crassicarpa]|uniref:Uncharacterized protein n=1 Tax=Acacia crassicarpa TaxID=499986 RepID=A0AAE1N6L3_9FABA|nr:hypothetical protein QN277_000571 [Acacia crassicarpa]